VTPSSAEVDGARQIFTVRMARALCGDWIAGTRGGLGFDGSNEGSAFSVPAAEVRHATVVGRLCLTSA
jgi:hypothetical protein